MKKITAFAVMTLLCASAWLVLRNCVGNNMTEDDIPTTDTLTVDSIPTTELEEIIAETPMPKTAEELFDDFFFNFATNRKLQLRRIKFPLQITTDGNVTTMEREDWRQESFFIHRDCYTLIFDNQRQMAAPKDTTVSHTIVEQISLESKRISQHYFDRKNGEWRMTEVKNVPFAGQPNESFLEFYRQFVSDNDFQLSSIADPLEFSGPDPDDELSTMDGLLLPEQWPSFAPPLPQGVIYNVVYGEQTPGSNQKILLIQGISNGFQTELVFQKKHGRWQLVRLQV